MMNEPGLMTLAALGGAACGAVFFGGLWWTVRRGLQSTVPAAWFLGSLLLRTGCVVTGFLLIAQGDWRRMLACLLGFFGVRIATQLATQ